MANTGTRATRAKTSHGTGSITSSTGTQLERFFMESLKDIYWAEKHLTKALPKLQKAATTEELKDAIDEHLAQKRRPSLHDLAKAYCGSGGGPADMSTRKLAGYGRD